MSFVSYGGQSQLLGAGGMVQKATDWSEVAPWTHAWSVAESTVESGRVVKIPDMVGGRPMLRWPNTFPLLGALPDVPLPGPLYIPSSKRFNGRPGLFCDHRPEYTGSFFGDLYSALTPNVSEDGTEAIGHPDLDHDIYFNEPTGLPQPYWVAVLGRLGLPDDFGADPETSPTGIFDATHGGKGTGPTIGRKVVGAGNNNWQFSNFGPGLVLITTNHVATINETVFIICYVNGANSFLEVTWRNANGTLGTDRVVGNMLGWNYLECFIGWVHGQYLCDMAIRVGVFDEDEGDQARLWASYWIPPAGALPGEP